MEEIKKQIWSVSLIPYHPSIGFMLGEEYRWKENDMKFHMIGGRVEDFDEDPIATASREFVEETNLLAFPYMQEVAQQNFADWVKGLSPEEGIHCNTVYPHFTFFVQKIIEDEIRMNEDYIDEMVSPNGKVHRFYLLDVLKIKNRKLQKLLFQLPFLYISLHPCMRSEGKMWSLYWMQNEHINLIDNKTTLLNRFVFLFFQRKKQQKKNLFQHQHQHQQQQTPFLHFQSYQQHSSMFNQPLSSPQLELLTNNMKY